MAEARAVEVRCRQADGAFAETSWDRLVAHESRVGERAGHIREVLTAYRSGFTEGAQPGEPRDEERARPDARRDGTANYA